HTFATFPRFAAVAARHLGDMLAATRRIAAAGNGQYIEQITDPGVAFAPELLGKDTAYDPNDFERDLAALAPILPGLVAQARAEYDAAEAKMRDTLHCESPERKPDC